MAGAERKTRNERKDHAVSAHRPWFLSLHDSGYLMPNTYRSCLEASVRVPDDPKVIPFCLLFTILPGSVAHSQDKDRVPGKVNRPFLVSELIHGYKHWQPVELTKREDGLYIIAESEYQKAREQT